MEQQNQQHYLHQQQHLTNNIEDGVGSKNNNSNSSSSSFMCRQSSTRWTPTSDQIRILKDLYYNNGVRSPTAEQIQRISAKLRQYGKIEGKNVFYWFQNHKARERQKKRLIAAASATDNNININNNISPMQMRPHVWRSVDDHKYNNNNNNNTSSPGLHCPSASSHGVLAVGQNGNYGYGTMAMEKSFRDCSISPGGNSNGSMNHQNFTWVGVDPYMTSPTTYPFLEKTNKYYEETLDEEQEEENYQRGSSGLETLPLFPMHEENMISSLCSSSIKYHESSGGGGWYSSDDHHNNLAALELSLNSFIGRSPNFP